LPNRETASGQPCDSRHCEDREAEARGAVKQALKAPGF